jgi:transposase
MKLHVFCFDLPQSDACFIKAYPAETTEAFLDGHVSAFAFFWRRADLDFVRQSQNRVARILGDGKRQRTRAFTELVSNYLLRQWFNAPRPRSFEASVPIAPVRCCFQGKDMRVRWPCHVGQVRRAS